MSLVQDLSHGHAQLELAHALVDGWQLCCLFPGRGHQLLLVLLNHAGSERSCDAPAWIQVELVEPRRTCWRYRRPSGVPSTVDGWREQRVGIGVGRLATAWFIDDPGKCGLELQRE